jgi:hypothetical protein
VLIPSKLSAERTSASKPNEVQLARQRWCLCANIASE